MLYPTVTYPNYDAVYSQLNNGGFTLALLDDNYKAMHDGADAAAGPSAPAPSCTGRRPTPNTRRSTDSRVPA